MKRSIFDAISINSMKCRNRTLMSAAADNLSDENGYPTDVSEDRFRTLAAGGIGLVISGGMHVRDSGKSSPDKPHIIHDEAIPKWKRLTDAVHEEGGCMALQLTHAGIGASTYQNTLGREGLAVGVLPEDSLFFKTVMAPIGKYHAATEEEIDELITAFGKAAARVRAAGADAVELHSAHDSLLCHFLSPVTNTRTDRWGGPVENRVRIHQAIYRAIREYAGDDFPIGIKLGIADGFTGGMKARDGLAAARILSETGYDFIEVSQGLQDLSKVCFEERGWLGTPMHTHVFKPKDEAYFRSWTQAIEPRSGCTIVLTGGIRSFDVAEDIIQTGDADMIGMCRPFIMEPDLINTWARGDHHRARCVSCNKCVMALAMEGKPLSCSIKNSLQ